MSARLLILTAAFGEGHNAAARALAAACDCSHGPGTARVEDVFALASPRLNEVFRRCYLGLINRLPAAWSLAYRSLEMPGITAVAFSLLWRERRVLGELMARERPDAICCTYPVYAFLLRRLARQGRLTVPFYNVVTDSISIHPLWWRAGAAGWFVPNEDSAEVMRRAGVATDKIHVSGFPVQPFFDAHTRELAPPRLGDRATPRVLYIINSGTAGAAETARRLLTDTPWEITCTVGRNETLRAELAQLAAARPGRCRILGWTDQIPRLLMTHHVVISKAGGATTQEALAARCPMIVNQIVPGQEEGNYELLRRHGIGALAETPAEALAALQRAFADQGRVWHQWRLAIAPLVRTRAAYDINRAVLGSVEGSHGDEVEPIPLPFRVAATA
ncbi:MGDG synthase family glycosyltransferase [Horticoccus sp. 23ND18S-11]|uniref:MGDG synthase family glycosyltransferase n=1 Tax=Horticoccus sp. 23ND18S-11 TaxID=3391832 RepID=UPI0039C9A507